MEYNSRLFYYLNLNQLTLDELSYMTGVSLVKLKGLMHSDQHLDGITLEEMKRIAEVLNCKIDDLFEFEE